MEGPAGAGLLRGGGTKLVNCYHIKKPQAPRGRKVVLGGGGRPRLNLPHLLSLSLMCLITVSDFQQQIANQYAQRRPASLLLQAEANVDANRLYEDLMMTYNRIVLPVENNTDRVVVKLSLKLSQLIDVNLKNQMMTTNVWLNQEWSDYKLKWDPSEYGGIQDINVPAEQIWLPDIVLYNSAEGYFAVSIMTKAKVRYDGHVTWNPPAIFRSSCQIDITYFPFDSQNCHLKFGSWTFGTKIDLRHINDTEIIERGTDLSEYYQNVEWDIMQASARRNVITYICCPNDFYPDVTFNFTLRRKPLFYTVNLILPCIGITILSFLVFYLPSDSGEKVTLTISILVSLIFFLSVLIETIPSTSLAMPLLGKYLVFTMILITLSVCATVCVLNIHFRTPSTHSMPNWVKRWCIDILPRYLFMNVPQYQSLQSNVLPEQLVYLYNQAYARPLPSQTGATTPRTDQSSSSQRQQSTANHLLAHSGNTMHQLDPRSLAKLHDQNKLNSSPSSLFLPYLQSEAARRLKLQRSRSSDRDRSTSDGNQNTTSILINDGNTSTNNDCDRLEWGARVTPVVSVERVGSETSGSSDSNRRSTTEKRLNGAKSAQKNPQRKYKSGSRGETNKGWLNHLFGSRRNKVSSSTDDQESGQNSRSNEKGKKRRAHVMPRQDTSSSVEYDYQHHNHFQARASVCSNNMWRVGPSRRCSTSVPVNYPTYYQPLVHLASKQQAPRSELQNRLRTLSGCITQGHLHSLHETSVKGAEMLDGSANTDPAAANGSSFELKPNEQNVTGALQTRASQQMSGRPELRALDAQTLVADSHQTLVSKQPVPYQPTLQHAHIYPRQQHVSDLMPTPPPPLPPSGNLSHLIDQQRKLVMEDDNQRRVPPVPLLGVPGLNQQIPASNLTAHPVKARENCWSMGPISGSMETNSSNTNNNNNNFTQLSGQMNSSNQIGYHIDSNARQSLNRAPPLSQIHLFPAQNTNLQPQQVTLQYIPRSRSTDYRLCSHLRDQIYLSSGQQQGVVYEQQAQNRPFGQPTLFQAPLLHRTVAPGPQVLQQHLIPGQSQPHTIGRALGQAYMQRLQRQPTIYSLGASIQRPSRSTQRGMTPQQQHYQQMELLHQQSNRFSSSYHDRFPRSRSQNSLDRRARLAGMDGDCHQCNSSALHRTSSRIMLTQPHETNCSSGFEVRRCAENQSCDQGANGPSFRCNLSTGKVLCNGGGCSDGCYYTPGRCLQNSSHLDGPNPCGPDKEVAGGKCSKLTCQPARQPAPLTNLGLMKLISDVDKAIQNAMFIAQHIDNLDEFESVKENWKYIAMVIDRIFLIVFLIACIGGTVAIFGMVPWENYTVDKPIDLQLTRLLALNLTGNEQYSRSCRDF